MNVKRKIRANALVDILIAIVSILVLVGVARLMYGNSLETARVSQARTGVKDLAEAQQRVFAAHGVFVPLQVLDDVSTGTQNVIHPDKGDYIGREPITVMAIDPNKVDEGTQVALNMAISDWAGPYYQPRRIYAGNLEGATVPTEWTQDILTSDYPLDPWGQPYRLYSSRGLVGTAAAAGTDEAYASAEFSDGVLTDNEDRGYDDFAIVSFGPDKTSDSVSMNDDDVIYFFGPESSAGSAGEQTPEKQTQE